jgi:hypothetical protein
MTLEELFDYTPLGKRTTVQRGFDPREEKKQQVPPVDYQALPAKKKEIVQKTFDPRKIKEPDQLVPKEPSKPRTKRLF